MGSTLLIFLVFTVVFVMSSLYVLFQMLLVSIDCPYLMASWVFANLSNRTSAGSNTQLVLN